MDRLETRIGGWKDKWFLTDGKITKIKSILSVIPIYPLSCLPLPRNTNKKLEKILRSFLWNDCEDSKNFPS